ncbi:MAG: glycosyltransferase [Verrucomicrobiota bacterium]
MISFIVPAHNEEFTLPKTLQAIHDSAHAVDEPYEVIVVNDASTDATAEVARKHNAAVLSVNHRQIAATRNSGGRAARGDRLFFVDADTTVTPRAVESALRWMDNGVAGGGAPTRFEGSVPLYARLLLVWLGFFMKIVSITGGAFMFCTRQAFHAVGGFDERLYGAEDAAMSAALKREGRFVVLNERLFTSGRRVRALSGLQTLALLARIAFAPSHLTRRSSVEKVWYVSTRKGETETTYSLAVRISNGIALVILLVLVTLPIWAVPWPRALLNGPLGALKFGAQIILAHAGLVLWPCSFFLARNFLQQKRLLDRLKLGVLIAVSLWFACRAALRVCGIWWSLIHWLAN